MAVLTPAQLAEMRRSLEKDDTLGAVNFTKVEANQALQAIEDWWEANRANLNTAINTATSPFVFTVAQKKLIGRYWLWHKFGQGG